MLMKILEFKWSNGRYGNICRLYVDGKHVSTATGCGYDMAGTCLGEYVTTAYRDELLKITRPMYGLTFHDKTYDTGKARIGIDCDNRTISPEEGEGLTVEEAEKRHISVGLERYQAFYRHASDLPTDRHTVPLINGACGFRSVEKILEEIGWELVYVYARKNKQCYKLIPKVGGKHEMSSL